ncbi:MAG: OmpA family protein, partial [Candidatus Omnitrophota bacterium]|nr:OmpA family protein [Candidatus Omnitrophota bacterium]MBU1928979.1 OmpA family protein [Candidatus Omnitrophota bacterium]MBU2035736.1 OmpA family protein [Candidatus Omnitrophota bacterium]
QLSEKTEESKKLNSEYAGLKDSQALLEQAKKDFSQKSADYEARVKDLKKLVIQLQGQVDSDSVIIKNLNGDIAKRSVALNNETRARDIKIKDLETELTKQNYENLGKIKSLQDKINEREKELEKIRKESGSLTVAVDRTQIEAAKWIVELTDAKDRMQKDFQQEINEYKMKLDLSKQGIVVTVLSDVLFDSGSNVIKPESKIILKKIADALDYNIKDNQIIIEGHTDNDPIKHSGWKSNWELSSVRAISVLNYFTKECGLEADRFAVNAYGEFKPVADNKIKEGKAKNRRVEIIILPTKIIKVKAGR